MTTVNMLEAKTNLSRLVEAVENGTEPEIIIARDGRPAVRIVPLLPVVGTSRRLGLLAGRYPIMSWEDFDADNDAIATSFYDGTD